MRVLFDLNHPAHVHLFKHAIGALERDGHPVAVTSRNKEMTLALLDAYDIDHEPLSRARSGLAGMAVEFPRRELAFLAAARRFEPDVVVSRPAPWTAHAASVLDCRCLAVKDTVITSPVIRVAFEGLTLPFVDDLCTPPGFDPPVLRGTLHTLPLQELAYLHPNRFEPRPEVLERHDISPDRRYFVVRFAAWEAFHDIGSDGLSLTTKRELVSTLSNTGEVYVTSEAPLPPSLAAHDPDLPPEAVHDLLYYADLYVGDSETMATEAALLGTPAVRVHPFVGESDLYNARTLEDAGLLFSFTDEAAAIEQARAVAEMDPDGRWQRRRTRVVEAHEDVTATLLDLIRGDTQTADRPVEPGETLVPPQRG